MSSNIILYFRLLKDVSDGLELLYDLSHECDCPYVDNLQDALVSIAEFKNKVHSDILIKSDIREDLPF